MTLTGSSATESHRTHEGSPDTASELLIAELVLDDLAAVRGTQRSEDALCSDEDIALDFQAASLNALIGVLHDSQFASSINHAIESDARELGRLARLELAERDDHRAAVAFGDGQDMPRQTLSQRIMERTLAQPARSTRAHGFVLQPLTIPREPPPAHHGRTSNNTEADMGAINAGMEDVHISTPLEASRTVPRQSSKNPEIGPECVICGDDVVASRSFKAPCTHRYCRGCIVSLVETSLRDESLHPLRCCRQPLSLESGVFGFISSTIRLQFLTKCREYSIPAGSRVYCSNPRCSMFLDASGNTKRDLTCDACDTISCSQCKNNAHPGEGCFEHQSTLELRETAAANKWQTCPGCHAIVELNQGCYHIICRCLTQFCYLCSARWKTCDCRQWDEERLLNDAERRVRNEFGDLAARAQPAVHAERVNQQMEQLRENHECQMHFWRYRHGSGQCEECGDVLGIFLMRCIYCQALACRRCSVNRL